MATRGESRMSDRKSGGGDEGAPVEGEPKPQVEQGYTEDEEAEVHKRLEDLGYVE